MAVMAPELISLKKAAERFGIGPHTLNVWIREGRIPPELVVEQTRRRRFLLWDPTRLPRREDGTLPGSDGSSGDD